MPWSCHLRGSIVMHVWEPFSSEYLSDLSHADCVRATVFMQQRCDDHKTSFPLEMDFFTGNGGQYNCQWTSYNKQTNRQTTIFYTGLFSPKKLCQNVPNITMKPLACSWWFHLTLGFWTFRHLSIVHIN